MNNANKAFNPQIGFLNHLEALNQQILIKSSQESLDPLGILGPLEPRTLTRKPLNPEEFIWTYVDTNEVITDKELSKQVQTIQLQCTECNELLANKRLYDQHMWRVHKIMEYRCLHLGCGLSFADR